MCRICIEYNYGLMTKKEAVRNLYEKISTYNQKNMATEEEFEHILMMETMLEEQNPETD